MKILYYANCGKFLLSYLDFFYVKWYNERVMWEGLFRAPLGRTLQRKLGLVFTALSAAVFAQLLFVSTPVFAEDASWQGSDIVYQNNTYTKCTSSADCGNVQFAQGANYYAYEQPPTNGSSIGKAFVIYFTTGTDPPTATSANYVSYDMNGDTYINPGQPQKITITKASATQAAPNNSDPGEQKSCDVDGIGWIVCSASKAMARGMDLVYKAVSNFLAVQPLQSTMKYSTYPLWDVVRSIANIAFVIAFLIIIYSQLTATGLSNYGLKKLLPRLVVAAILVNISYWICAIAIDISNIIGYGIHDIFKGALAQVEPVNQSLGDLTWSNFFSFIMSGGTIAVGSILGTSAAVTAMAGLDVTGMALFVAPIAAGVFLIILVAMIILAARQALIILLILISPLAFVAYLLPNTEKWFERWRSTLFVLLFLFPGFSAIFGASQLASAIVIRVAEGPNMIFMVLLALAIQAVPLALLPILLKLGGGVLNRFAGLVDDKRKGIHDRTKNWSQDRLGERRARKGAENAAMRASGNWRKRDAFTGRRYAARKDAMKNYRESMKANHEEETKNEWQKQATRYGGGNSYDTPLGDQTSRLRADRRGYGDTSAAKKLNQFTSKQLDAEDEQKWQERFDMKNTNFDRELFEREAGTRHTTDLAKVSEERMDTAYKEMRAGGNPYHVNGIQGPASQRYDQLMTDVTATAETLSIEAIKKANAETQLDSNLTQTLLRDEQLRAIAGGVRGESGAESALASAVAKYRGEYGKKIEEKTQLMKHFNLSSTQRQDVAVGNSDVTVTRDGSSYTFKVDDEYAREATIESQLKTGSFNQIEEIINESGAGGSTHEYRTTISDAIVTNGLMNKAIYWGAKTIDDVSQGTYSGAEKSNAITYFIREGKIKPEALAAQNGIATRAMFEVVNDTTAMAAMSPQQRAVFNDRYRALQEAAYKILHTDNLKGIPDEASRDALEEFAVPPPPED